MDLFKIYRRGWDARATLKRWQAVANMTHAAPGEPRSIAGRIDALNNQIEELQLMWGRSTHPQPEVDRLIFERDIQAHQDAISNLKRLAESSMRDACMGGKIIALGYSQAGGKTGHPDIAAIQVKTWPLLEIDFESSTASRGEIRFEAVRFLFSSDVTEADYGILAEAFNLDGQGESISNAVDEITTPPHTKWRKAFEYESEGLNALYQLIEDHFFDTEGNPIYDPKKWPGQKSLTSNFFEGYQIEHVDRIVITAGKRKGKAEK
jgi:hypothetical protein